MRQLGDNSQEDRKKKYSTDALTLVVQGQATAGWHVAERVEGQVAAVAEIVAVELRQLGGHRWLERAASHH